MRETACSMQKTQKPTRPDSSENIWKDLTVKKRRTKQNNFPPSVTAHMSEATPNVSSGLDGSLPLIGNTGDASSTDEEKHHRLSEYKAKGKSDQQRRREEQLQRQKNKRGNLAELARKLATEHVDEDAASAENRIQTPAPQPTQATMEVVSISKEEREKQLEERRANFYRNQLMLPEYMQDVPSDLIGNWFVVPCPSTPQKCLVIASGGVTTSRLTTGVLLNKFSSNLPGGSRIQGGSRNSFTILDCIYHPDTQTYFVLDLMAWRGCLYYDCATDFRYLFFCFLWLFVICLRCDVSCCACSWDCKLLDCCSCSALHVMRNGSVTDVYLIVWYLTFFSFAVAGMQNFLDEFQTQRSCVSHGVTREPFSFCAFTFLWVWHGWFACCCRRPLSCATRRFTVLQQTNSVHFWNNTLVVLFTIGKLSSVFGNAATATGTATSATDAVVTNTVCKN